MKTTFAVVVDDNYAGFIPFYIYFALRAYPESWVLVYLRGRLSDRIHEQITTLCPNGRYTIFLNYKANYPQDVFTTKALRWTLSLDASLMGDRLYVGDVDIMLAKENDSLFYQHNIHCDTLKLPYSNIIRGLVPRMSGLHYIQVQEYKDQMAEQIRYYDHRLKIGNVLQYQNRNERLLFEMLANEFTTPEKGSFELGYDPTKINYRPHHGIHLGIFRGVVPPSAQKHLKAPEYKIYFADFLKVLQESSCLRSFIFDNLDDKVPAIFYQAFLYAQNVIPERMT